MYHKDYRDCRYCLVTSSFLPLSISSLSFNLSLSPRQSPDASVSLSLPTFLLSLCQYVVSFTSHSCQMLCIWCLPSAYTNICRFLSFPPLSYSSQSTFLPPLHSCTKHTHLAFAPNQQREVPGGGDPSRWQWRSAAASRTVLCGSASAFGDDLVSQSVIHTGSINIWWSHRTARCYSATGKNTVKCILLQRNEKLFYCWLSSDILKTFCASFSQCIDSY